MDGTKRIGEIIGSIKSILPRVRFGSGSSLGSGLAHYQNVSWALAAQLGDLNCDSEINLLDVAPFVDVLTSGDYVAKADVNQDGIVDLLDIVPFVDLLSAG